MGLTSSMMNYFFPEETEEEKKKRKEKEDAANRALNPIRSRVDRYKQIIADAEK